MDDGAQPAETFSTGSSTIAGRGLFSDDDKPAGSTVALFDCFPELVTDFGYVNHSCDPNLAWHGRVQIARRDIRAGDELTVDYSTAIDDPSYVLYCHCGSTRCRQAVEGTDWQIPQLQARYAGQWTPRIQRRINATG